MTNNDPCKTTDGFLKLECAQSYIWNYVDAKELSRPFSLLFEVDKAKSIIEGSLGVFFLKGEKEDEFNAFANEVTHIRIYLGIKDTSTMELTLIMIGTKQTGGQNFVDITSRIVDFAVPCPPNNCWDATSPLESRP